MELCPSSNVQTGAVASIAEHPFALLARLRCRAVGGDRYGRAMTRTIFNTACTIDGFIADEQDRLDWLFAVDGADDAEAGFAAFLDGIGAIIMGSTTYAWSLAQEQLMAHPARWAAT